jgi:hypothetical protein
MDVVAVVVDLYFQSRILAAAKAANRSVRFLADVSRLPPAVGVVPALVDLDAPGDVLASIRGLRAGGYAPIIAFGPHVDTTGRKAAREAGATRVLAKSRFVTELPRLMREAPSADPDRA